MHGVTVMTVTTLGKYLDSSLSKSVATLHRGWGNVAARQIVCQVVFW